MSLRLIIEDDEGSTTIVPLGKESITIGRQTGNTIQLTEKNVSRRHARLTPDGDAWVIEDLGSYNGVKVNGRPVDARVVLQEGDVVQIGDYHLALTEDVDRRSLNYDRPRSGAANDVAEPMLASSSTNLPRLSQSELAALSSGQHPQAVAPPQMIVDSGQMPMARVPPPYQADEPRRRTGMMVGLGLAVVGVVALGSFWVVANGGFGGKPEGTQIAKNETRAVDAKNTAEPAKAEPAKTSDTPPTPPVTPTPTPTPADAKQVAPADPTGTQEAAPPPESDDGDVVVDEPPDEQPPSPTPTAAKQPKKSSPAQPKKSNPSPPPTTPSKPTPPPTPAVDTDALLSDANNALFKNPSQAYDLASKAYNAKKSGEAVFLMARAACRMGDEGKARKWIKQLKGSKRDDAVKLCQLKGITIE